MRGCSGLLTSAGISGYGCQEVRRHTERRACRQAMEAWAQWKPVLPSCKVVLKLAPMVLMRPACEFKQPVCVCVCVLGENALVSLTQARSNFLLREEKKGQRASAGSKGHL